MSWNLWLVALMASIGAAFPSDLQDATTTQTTPATATTTATTTTTVRPMRYNTKFNGASYLYQTSDSLPTKSTKSADGAELPSPSSSAVSKMLSGKMLAAVAMQPQSLAPIPIGGSGPGPGPGSSPGIATKSNAAKYYNKGLPKKRRGDDLSSIRIGVDDDMQAWQCPNITDTRSLECSCDLPHTLRCNGDLHGLSLLSEKLRATSYSISLLDCSLRNVTYLSDAKIFDGIALHGLVISSGEIKRVHKSAFLGIKGPLQALGLPGNALLSVPWSSIATLNSLERLDLSNNKIKAIGTSDLVSLVNLIYLELSNNQISSISQRAFLNLRRLEVLKLGGNRLGDYPTSLKALIQCYNLRELDLSANNLNGPLTTGTLPSLISLEALNLNRNLLKSIQNKAMQNFSHLISLSLRHNQIDVLQDHAFYGLSRLESLDLSYNGIVAVSSASLQHLTRLTTLDLTHNFLRALTSDLIAPLPSLRELRLAGNDISIVAKNALDGARELKSLSIQENPLSCDCTIRSFAEWLQVAKIQSQDLISPTCVTPPRLEGAPLIQVPLESLNCDMDNVEKDNASIMEQLEAITRQNHSTHVRDLSEEIILHELHFSADYGLILTWILNLSKNDYMCDAIFVYREENINEILIDNSPIHCESKIINGQNMVSVIVPDSSSLDIGESYRFCLVMVQEKNPKADLNVGCSNITKLQLSTPGSVNEIRQFLSRRPYYAVDLSSPSASSSPVSSSSSELNDFDSLPEEHYINGRHFLEPPKRYGDNDNTISYQFIETLNKCIVPSLLLGISVIILGLIIWSVIGKRKNARANSDTTSTTSSSGSGSCHHNNNNSRPGTPTATTCYAASEHIAHRLADVDNAGARYLKLQATTSL